MNKKLFTLMEILFVVLIVGILIYSFSKFFQMSQRDEIYGQACISNVYGQIRNFVDNASTGRGIYISGQTTNLISPDKYIINSDISGDTITMSFSGTESGSGIYNMIALNKTGIDNKNNCYGNNYYINLTGINLAVSVNKLLMGDINNPPFQISGSTVNDITGDIQMDYCFRDGRCKVLGLLEFDKRTLNININKCLLWKNGGSDCDKWSR